MKVFISYSHQQGKWVWDRLVPCLRAGGVEVLIDLDRFEVGKAVRGQMDSLQDKGDRHLLVLSQDYLASDYCLHEMKRALAHDPHGKLGNVIPVMRLHIPLPPVLSSFEPLYANLCDDEISSSWDQVFNACEAKLGCTAPNWLRVRDALRKQLRQNRSVNLVTMPGTAWRGLLDDIQNQEEPGVGVVDLGRPAAAARRGFVKAFLAACGAPTQVPQPPEDLVTLDEVLSRREVSKVALTHFHYVQYRFDQYGHELFFALRYLIEARKLVLIIQSEGKGFLELVPPDHPLSSVSMYTVKLQA